MTFSYILCGRDTLIQELLFIAWVGSPDSYHGGESVASQASKSGITFREQDRHLSTLTVKTRQARAALDR